MIYTYKVIAYAILVRGGRMLMEEQEGSALAVVPADYQMAVAEYLAK